jgi:hypothetical protein
MKKLVILGATAPISEVIAHPTMEGEFMILLQHDLKSIHPGLTNLDNTGIDRMRVSEAFIDVIKKREMIASMPFALSVLSQDGNIVAFDVEEIRVGDVITDADGDPVLDSDGNPRKYLGRADGSSKVGDVFHRVANMIVELGDNAKSMIDKNRQAVEVAVATAKAQEYVSQRAPRPERKRMIPSWATTPATEEVQNAPAGSGAHILTAEEIAGGASGDE